MLATGRGLAENLAGTLSDNWWVLLLRGIVAILFGILTFAQPGISLATLVLFFGSFAFVDGILKSYTAVTHRHDRDNWGMLLLSGLVGIGVGILTWMAPGITALTLLFYIAIWAIGTGVLEVITAIRLRKEIEHEWLLGLAGLASVAFGVLLMARPGAGALAVAWLIGTFAMVFGVSLAALSFKMRSFAHRLESHAV
jgi:uncharacterized membrane protein HdeD (DUF308 family)